jgi:molybdate/tungstate transport system substrate-binding protein
LFISPARKSEPDEVSAMPTFVFSLNWSCWPSSLTRATRLAPLLTLLLLALLGAPLATAASQDSKSNPSGSEVTLTQYGAGTLAVPFKAINALFEQAHPKIKVQAQFGGSVKMAKQITALHQPADVLAVADYNVIPQQLYGKGGEKAYANWYVGFASNAITFVYTDKSKGASKIDPGNWYQVLAEPGVEIGRSNPDTDPSGYQTLQMLELAERYYHKPGLAEAILKNAPDKNIRDTETELIGALESGQIDYLAIYRSDAMQHHFKYLQLPSQIDLSDPSLATEYAGVSVHTKNGDLQARPIIYAATVPLNAPHPQEARQWMNFLLSAQSQTTLQNSGFVVIKPPIASEFKEVPAELKSQVKPWPGQ